MANIQTNLRELSVAIPFLSDESFLNITPKSFALICEDSIENFSLKTTKISTNPNNFSQIELSIIKNGFFLGKQLKSKLDISTSKNNKISWCGNLKDDLIDLSVNGYKISLKENSYILRNIGLYQLLNFVTNTNNFNRGLHIFKRFSPKEFENWFYQSIVALSKLETFSYASPKGYLVQGRIKNNTLSLKYNEDIQKINNINNLSYDDFEQLTTSTIREKVFSKWLKEIPIDSKYYTYKTDCALAAGRNLLAFLKKNMVISSPSILNFFNLEKFSYIYAKYDGNVCKIFNVPSITDINYHDFKISNIEISIPSSQLNLKTTITNLAKNTSCTLRNEIRYSHGQLNGTPEAKLYFDSGDDLSELIYTEL